MAKVKHVAAGFFQDAENLLEEFAKHDSRDFSAFADVWKKRSFSLIYMGRGDDEELREFTEEIFHVASKFVSCSQEIRQVGGIYLLYALYRHQTLNPSMKIRLVQDQMAIITKLRDTLPLNDHKTFHYVASYLLQNSFDFVACARPMGPTMTGKLTDDWKRECRDNLYRLKIDLKKDMTELVERNVLTELWDMFNEYSNLKKAVNVPAGLTSDATDSLLEYTVDLESLLGIGTRKSTVRGRKSTSSVRGRKPTRSIGSRRVDLKMKAFEFPACSNANVESNDSDWDLPIIPPPIRRRFRKPRRGSRKVGRPWKPGKDDSDDDLGPNSSGKNKKGSNVKVNKNNCVDDPNHQNKIMPRPRVSRYHYSKGEELKKIAFYENMKFGSSKTGGHLFSDSEVDDPKSSIELAEAVYSESSE